MYGLLHAKRIETLKLEIEREKSLSICEKIQERITRLASAIAIIKVGASTEVEMIFFTGLTWGKNVIRLEGAEKAGKGRNL